MPNRFKIFYHVFYQVHIEKDRFIHILNYGRVLNCAFKQIVVWAEECNESTATVEVIPHCPKTLEEQVEAAVRKSCSKYSHTCSSFVYHCVMNVWENETLEVCAPRKIIVGKLMFQMS